MTLPTLAPPTTALPRHMRHLRALAVNLLLALLCATVARADGGHIALRATSGATGITLFTAPEPLVSGPVDLSLLVQDTTTGEVAGEADVTVLITGPHGSPFRLPLSHAAAGNKLLLAALPTLAEPGDYAVTLHVARPGQPDANFSTVLHVATNHRRRTTLLFALGLPLAATLLFLVNQQAKFGSRRSRSPALH